jgi:DNA polymerase-3 subunit delta
LIYLLVDDGAGRARLRALQATLGDPSTAALNTSTFDGRVDLGALMAAAEAMPFLSERRLVIVRGLLARGGDAETGTRRGRSETDEALAEYVGRAPPTTDVVFLESEPPPKGAILRAIEKLAERGQAEVVVEQPLDERGAVDFLRGATQTLGVRIDGEAAMALVGALGPDRRGLEREVEKLALYAGEGGTVTMAVVRELVPAADESRIFELVDAIGARNARGAVRAWRNLVRSGEDAHRMLAMIARQVRMLIQAGELGRRPPFQLAQALGVPPRVAGGLAQQAQAWPPGALEDVLRQLVELDRESKTGGPDVEPALEALIAELVAPAGRPTGRPAR